MDIATILGQLQSGKLNAADATRLIDEISGPQGGLTVKAIDPAYGHPMVEVGGNVRPKKLSAKLLGQLLDPQYRRAIESAISEARQKAESLK